MFILLGAGNLATNLALALLKNGIKIEQVYSRTEESASALGKKINTTYTNNINHVRTDANVYIYALSDDALVTVSEQINAPNALHIHTAGSVSLDVFSAHKKHYGVLYPLQTFSKDKKVSFHEIPIFIEANSTNSLEQIRVLAEEISPKIYELNSANRAKMHLAAVFACNFTNRMYAIANELLADTHIPFDVLLPLIDETARKVHTIKPAEAQTGPAVRFDKKIMEKHLAMLSDEYLKMMYELISDNIYKNTPNNELKTNK